MPQFPGHNDQVTRYVAAELSHMSKQRIPGPAAQALVLVSNIIMACYCEENFTANIYADGTKTSTTKSSTTTSCYAT